MLTSLMTSEPEEESGSQFSKLGSTGKHSLSEEESMERAGIKYYT